MALYPVPPTVARFRAGCVKPEAFQGMGDDVIALALEHAAAEVQSALSNRATLPILEWDAACDGAARAIATRSLIGHRGYNRQAGADTEYVALAERADKYLERIINNEVSPLYVDSGGNEPLNAPRILSSDTSDAWVTRRRHGQCR